MILVISNYGEFLPISQRIAAEGISVFNYIHEPAYKRVMDGLVRKITLDQILPTLKKCEVVIFDITQHNRKKPHDLKLLAKFGLPASETDLFGSIADKLKSKPYSKIVVGASRWASKLEWDREYGMEIARQIGLSVPDYETFNTVQDGIKFLESSAGKQGRWVLKPYDDSETEWTYPETFEGELCDILKMSILPRFGNNTKFILQEMIDGVELATEGWTDGDKYSFFTRTLECKKQSDGELGKATGSQLNTYWLAQDQKGIVIPQLRKLADIAVDDYVGMTDANCIVTEQGKAYFLEWTRRFGWSSTYLACSFVPKGQLGNFFINGFKAVFNKGYVSSEVVSLWPYPGGHSKDLVENCRDNLVDLTPRQLRDLWLQDVYQVEDEDGGRKLRCAGVSGMIGVMASLGDTIEDSITNLYKQLDKKKLHITGNKQWRTEADHREQISKRVKNLDKWGIRYL